jgi:hypothetical protein
LNTVSPGVLRVLAVPIFSTYFIWNYAALKNVIQSTVQ